MGRYREIDIKTENGCWVDSSLGFEYVGRRILDIASHYGFDPPYSLDETASRSEKALGEAEDYLNEHVAPEGWYFGHAPHDTGDWGLWCTPCETCEDDGTIQEPHAPDYNGPIGVSVDVPCPECKGESAKNACWRAYQGS